jgi:DNA-directed RNA polymerase subunit M/transcription elongation factor TFIIS
VEIAWIARWVQIMLLSQNGVVTVPGSGAVNGALTGEVRARSLVELVKALTPVLGECAPEYATHVEACAVTHSAHRYDVYITTMARVIYNLGNNGAYITGRYPVSHVCMLSHRRLGAETAPAERAQVTMQRVRGVIGKATELSKSMAAKAKTISSAGMGIKCPKCHRTDDIARSLNQSNRADEGMKTMLRCVCGTSWQM